MEWITTYETMMERDKSLFRDSINRLLAQSYLVFHREEDKAYYRFVDRNLDLVRGYLQMAGWTIHMAKDLLVISIQNSTDRNRKVLNQKETLFLLILRLIYEEKMRELSLAKHIVCTNQDIHERYLALEIKNRLPAQDEYVKILKLLSKHSLIALKDGSWADSNATLILYPSILLAIPVQAVEIWNQWILCEQKGGEEIEDLEEFEID